MTTFTKLLKSFQKKFFNRLWILIFYAKLTAKLIMTHLPSKTRSKSTFNMNWRQVQNFLLSRYNFTRNGVQGWQQKKEEKWKTEIKLKNWVLLIWNEKNEKYSRAICKYLNSINTYLFSCKLASSTSFLFYFFHQTLLILNERAHC